MGSACRAWLPVLFGALALAAVVFGAPPVLAQTAPASGTPSPSGAPPPPGVGVVAPPPRPPAPEFGFEESLPLEEGGLREQNVYPERTRGVYAPAFVKGATRTVRTSRTSGLRMGLSGWTATRIPFDDQNAGGGPAFGLTIEWGVPLPPPPEPAAEPQR